MFLLFCDCFKENWIMQWPDITCAWLLSLSFPCTNSLLQDSEGISLEHIAHGFLVGRCFLIGGSHSYHFERVRNSDFVRIHSLSGWFQISWEAAVVPSECRATWKHCLLSASCSHAAIWQEAEEVGEVVAFISEPAEQIWQHRIELGRLCRWCSSRMVLELQCILLLPQSEADNRGNVPRLRWMVSKEVI